MCQPSIQPGLTLARLENRPILKSARAGPPARSMVHNEDSATLATAAKTSAKPKSSPKSTLAGSAPAKRSRTAPAKSAKAAPDPVDYLRKQVLTALDELKAKDVHEIDVRGKTSIADILVIASGTSTRHVKSLADEVVRFAKKAGMMPLGVEGQREAEWVLVDLGDIIVHVMLPRIREFYGLERLWTVGDDMPMAANAD
jgi:ribosome-associated protein